MGTPERTAAILCLELKRIIRSSPYTYADLAKIMNLSESGLKKILSKKDISASRLAQFCAALGISLSDLVNATEAQNFIDVTFTTTQEAAFLADAKCFLFFWFLVYERRSTTQIKELMRCDNSAVEKFLLKLDKLRLISYLHNGKIKLPSPKPIRWVGKSAFTKNLYKRWGKSLVYDLIENPKPDGQYFMLRYLQMSDDSFKELVSLLTKIEKETLNKSIRQMRVNKDSLKHVRWLTCLDQKSWGEQDVFSIKKPNS